MLGHVLLRLMGEMGALAWATRTGLCPSSHLGLSAVRTGVDPPRLLSPPARPTPTNTHLHVGRRPHVGQLRRHAPHPRVLRQQLPHHKVQQAGLAVCALDVRQLEQGVQPEPSGCPAVGALVQVVAQLQNRLQYQAEQEQQQGQQGQRGEPQQVGCWGPRW